jgi:tetratricopeptide (TPR) repeat protein
VVILLYGWWKRGRIGWNDVKASVPFWVISLVLGFGAMWVGQVYQEHNHTGSDAITLGGIFSRLACAGLSLSFYFSKCFLPVELMPVYPQWTVDPPTLWQFLPWPVLGVAIYWLWTKRQGWGRHALLGWGFFVLFLAPFLGFNAISYMSFTWVMDHFLYLPIIGLIGLVVAGLGRLDEQLSTSFRPYSLGLVTVVLAFLAFESRSYAKLYLNSETLWSYELQHNPEAYPAHNNLGFALEQTSRLSEAIEQYGQALRLKPDYAEAYYNLGNALQKAGRLSEAIEQYEQALRLKPDYAETHNNLGFALFHNGQFSEAADQFEQALRLQPDDAEAHNNLGNVLVQTGRAPEAMEQYQMALRIRPAYAEAHNNLGNMLLRTGQLSEAMEQYQQALQVNPDYAEAHDNLGSALGQTGRLAEAREQFEQALRIKPDFAEASYNLGTVLLKTGRLSEAIEQYRQTLRIKPDYAQAHDNLGNALLQTGRLAEAIDQFEQALRIKPDYALARNNLARAQALQKTAPANK